MKRYILLLGVLIFSIVLYAQKNTYYYTNGDSYTIDENDTLSISLLNGKNADWGLYIKVINSYDFFSETYYKKFIETNDTNKFEFTVKDIDLNWILNAFECIVDDADPYYQGYILCKTDVVDTIPLKFDLHPKKPIIKDFKLTYDSYDFSTGYFLNSVFTMTFQGERFEYVDLWTNTSGLSPDMDGYYFFDIGVPIKPIQIDSVTYNFTWEWNSNQGLMIQLYNEYGASYSDTIWTIDYITDTEILRDLMTNIDNVCETLDDIIINDKSIILNITAKKVILYDLKGVKIYDAENVEEIERALFQNGIYIIYIQTADERL